MRKGGIGRSGGAPVREIPVVSRVMNCSSVPGGAPAMRGSLSAQVGVGYVCFNCTGPPMSQWFRKALPFSSRGVWQRSHIATFSTMYLPRSIEAGFRRLVLSPVFFACFSWALLDCEAVPTSNNRAVRDSLVSLFIGSSLCGCRGFSRDFLELYGLVDEKQVGEQRPNMDGSVHGVVQLRAERWVG